MEQYVSSKTELPTDLGAATTYPAVTRRAIAVRNGACMLISFSTWDEEKGPRLSKKSLDLIECRL